MKKFTPDEIKKKVGKEEKELREKVLLLSNGMIDVHGFKRDDAFERAIIIARDWYANGGQYKRKKTN